MKDNIKKMLRSSIRKKMNALEMEYIRSSNEQILERLRKLTVYQSAEVVFCYVSVAREINTLPILQELWQRGSKVAVPLCLNSSGIMEGKLISSMEDLKKGYYGLLEPDINARTVEKRDIDLAIVPCLSCDSHCSRLGQGGGYYDRFLAGHSEDQSFPAVALCREKLLSEEIPTEKWDEKMDMVITEKTVYMRKQNSQNKGDGV